MGLIASVRFSMGISVGRDIRQDHNVRRSTVAEPDDASVSNPRDTVQKVHFDVMVIKKAAFERVYGLIYRLFDRKQQSTTIRFCERLSPFVWCRDNV